MADVTEATSLSARKRTWSSSPLLISISSGDFLTVPRQQTINVNASPGFELKGVALDGKGKAEYLITLFSSCPGLKLHDLDLRDFKNCGVLVANCDGTANQPIVLSDLRFTTTAADQSGLYFTFISSSIQTTEHFIVEHCTLQRPRTSHPGDNPLRSKRSNCPTD